MNIVIVSSLACLSNAFTELLSSYAILSRESVYGRGGEKKRERVREMYMYIV